MQGIDQSNIGQDVTAGETAADRYKKFRDEIEPEIQAKRTKINDDWDEIPMTAAARGKRLPKI